MTISDKQLRDERIESLLESIWDRIEKPMVTAKFGDKWRDFSAANHTHEEAIHIAWKQGRYAILLENKIKELYETDKGFQMGIDLEGCEAQNAELRERVNELQTEIDTLRQSNQGHPHLARNLTELKEALKTRQSIAASYDTWRGLIETADRYEALRGEYLGTMENIRNRIEVPTVLYDEINLIVEKLKAE